MDTRQTDPEGNYILPAFSLNTNLPLTATATSARQPLGSAKSVRLHGKGLAAALSLNDCIHVAFGDAAVVASTADAVVTIHLSSPPDVLYAPEGTTHMAYIRGGASDIPFGLSLA